MARSVEITNGEKKVPLNEFTTELMDNVLSGVMKTLKGVNLEEGFTISIGKEGSR